MDPKHHADPKGVNSRAPPNLINYLHSPVASSPLSRESSNINLRSAATDRSNAGFSSPRFRSITPATFESKHMYSEIQLQRLRDYHLDFPEDEEEVRKLQLDPSSPYYSMRTSADYDLKKSLPYSTEKTKDITAYLGDIVSHIYISVKSLDLDGVISVNTFELEAARASIFKGEELKLSEASKEFDVNNVGSEDEDDSDSDEYEDADSDDDAAAATPVGKVEPQSAAIISLSHWTRELRVLLKMRRVFPVSLTKALVKVYFAICMSRGQHLNLSLYINVLQSLASHDVDILKENGLVLDWKPLFKEYSCHYPHAKSELDNHPKKSLNQLSQIAQAVSHFFDDSQTTEIIRESLKDFSPKTTTVSLLILTSLVPMTFRPVLNADGPTFQDNDIRKYLPVFFNLWTKGGSCAVYLVQLLSKISQSALKSFAKDPSVKSWGKFGIFTEAQFGYVCDSLFRAVRYPSKKKEAVYTIIGGLTGIIMMSITNEHTPNGPTEKLATVLKALSTYAHPSNSGAWSQHVAKTIRYLADELHKRVLNQSDDENVTKIRNFDLRGLPSDMKLNDNTVRIIINMLIPIINVGVQAKGREVSSYLSALELLAPLSPEQVLDSVFMDIYPSLENSISTHRLQVVLREMNVLVRFMASKPVYRVHIIRILSSLLPGVDSNDPIKARRTFELLSAVAGVIPFYDLSNGLGDGGMLGFQFTSDHLAFLEERFLQSQYNSNPAAIAPDSQTSFYFDPEIELEALKSATSTFQDFLHVFVENTFRLLDNLPEKVEGADLEVISVIPDTFAAIVESVSDELFDTIQSDVYSYVISNSKHSLVYVVAAIVETVVRRDPQKQFKKYISYLIPQIRFQIDENGAGSSRTGSDITPRDAELAWCLEMLCGAISAAPTQILEFSTQLRDISFYLLDNVKGFSLYTPTLLLCLLKAVSTRVILERRLISKDFIKRNGSVTEKCWGGFQFDPYRFDPENLSFEWFTPERSHAEFAVECLDSHVSQAMSSLTSLFSTFQEENSSDRAGNSTQKALEIVDQININLACLSCGLTGIAQFFDPLYKKYDATSGSFRGDLLQQKLKLLNTSNISAFNAEDTPVVMSRAPSNESSLEGLDSQIDGIEGGNSEDQAVIDSPIHVSKDIVDVPMSDNNSEDVYLIEQSGVATPNDLNMGSVNPELTGRQSGLFGFGYIFGEGTSSKIGDPLYQHLHNLREKIGRFLHELAEKVFLNNEGNIAIVKNLVICIEIWLRNVGYDVVGGFSGLTKPYVSSFNSQELKRMNSPFTRPVMGARLAVMHMKRLSLSRTDRVSSDLDLMLLKDLVQVAASPFANPSRRARLVLSACFGSMLKSSSAVYNVFPVWRKAVDKKDIESIKNILRIFRTKRIKGHVERGGRNLEYLDLLTESISIDHPEVSEIALHILKSIPDYLVVPKFVCLIDFDEIEAIKPTDGMVDFEVQSLMTAKKAKIERILSNITKLENRVIEHARDMKYWKYTVMALNITSVLQQFMSTTVNESAYEFIMESAGTSHPLVSKTAVSGVTSILAKVELLASVGYDASKLYDLNAKTSGVEKISTDPADHDGLDFSTVYRNEMQNLKSPSFFIDGSVVQPGLFWNDHIDVVSSSNLDRGLRLSDSDTALFRKVGSFLTKKWLSDILQLSCESMESSPIFQPVHVNFFKTITYLAVFKLSKTFTLDDLIDVAYEIYDKEKRATNILVAEIFCGIMMSFDHMDVTSREHADQRIMEKLRDIFAKDLTQDALSVWSIFMWWLADRVDFRRFPRILHDVCGFTIDKNNESPFADMARLRILRDYLASVGGNFSLFDEFIEISFQNLAYSYRIVEEMNASLFSSLLTSYPAEIPLSFEKYLELSTSDQLGFGYYPPQIPEEIKSRLSDVFDRVEELRIQVVDMDMNTIANSEYMYMARTLVMFLGKALQDDRACEILEAIQDKLLPFSFGLERVKDAANLAGVSYVHIFFHIGSLPLERLRVKNIQEFVHPDLLQASDSLTRQKHILRFIKFYYHVRFCSLPLPYQKLLLQTVEKLIFSQHLEVRELAGDVLSGIIHVFPVSEVDEVVKGCIQRFSGILTKDKKLLGKVKREVDSGKQITEIKNRIHGAVLGLGALIDAYPYTTPPPSWLPVVLADISLRASQMDGVIGRTAKETLSKFKKTRQDTWHIDSRFFSENQLSDLEGVLWKTYFL
ncbi:unnamed protein product [Kuraishia capsulata CBS 1993]|uniref:Proteasome activator Blm10 mid region domain-containing protein n=1 Tax=Kuraishia capsulata CBS 1993 TaxID=1382522 RepID=W6MS91_9ASCO|nr:uncharacterized protein KUCA_T00005654001 [Kuraishia capsulata CBS 1993]CDK29661.1 unnamed protein product [Kuraishia capsulata CBS 1993]